MSLFDIFINHKHLARLTNILVNAVTFAMSGSLIRRGLIDSQFPSVVIGIILWLVLYYMLLFDYVFRNRMEQNVKRLDKAILYNKVIKELVQTLKKNKAAKEDGLKPNGGKPK